MTTQFFSYNGNKVAYTREGRGKPILFLHNGGASKEIWTRQVDALRDRYEVICLDHLGFGESDMPESGYTLDKYVDLLSAFIDHLQTDKISVAANCMGSAMTLILADRRPEIFEALVLLNPLSEQTTRGGAIGLALPLVKRFPQLSLAASRRIRIPAPLTRFIIAAQYGPRGWRRGLITPLPGAAAAGAGWGRRGRLTSMAEMFSDLTLFRAIDQLRPGADFPPLAVVWGTANLGLSARKGRVLNRALEPDREEFLPRCGHLPMMENPEAVTAIIDEFVGAPPARRVGVTLVAPA
ncbi:alpha/beta hydrolase [Antrihabitans sp. YC3-6]|uniref:Alpha/beta hydrolase n=1 Tax=Antrihabitans stalagmiti TaxID=2799499 RepID=A0A934NVG4_9NOCA|nr:alpha/beta hydrolase [Antrihabitans stalagmiti]MBJ8342019.1 alpha/beta hydrolase [Antrihabitans stalagmiti]